MFVFVKDGVSLWSRMAMIATGTSAIMLSIIKRLEKVKQPEQFTIGKPFAKVI